MALRLFIWLKKMEPYSCTTKFTHFVYVCNTTMHIEKGQSFHHDIIVVFLSPASQFTLPTKASANQPLCNSAQAAFYASINLSPKLE